MSKPASLLMSSDLLKVKWDTSMQEAHRLMKASRVRHLPVVDEQDELVGVLSDRDVARAMSSLISIDDSGQGIYSETTEFDANAKVRHYMSWPVKTVEPTTDLRKVVGEMIVSKISALMVAEGGRALGIITSEDLLKALLGLLEHTEIMGGIDLRSILRGRD